MADIETLHRPVTTDCRCCGLPREFIFKSTTDQVVCDLCLRHQGDQTARVLRRDQQHKNWWAEYLDQLRQERTDVVENLDARHAAKVEALTQELNAERLRASAMEAAVKDGFKQVNPVVAVWLDQVAIAAEREQKEKAHRFIAVLLRVLWYIDQNHHTPENSDDRDCSCGVRADKCLDFSALASIRSRLYEWEANETARAKLGQHNELPRDHPEARHYGPNGWRRGA
ncbi:hypothetical protein ATK17_1615 [Branchiibius hedensis]|uniref:Uncharacterized protein n=1 Tax=Branchiibius hedensis TaxID=672460 RepID=A0A2Y8ZPL5_9MICO|nr:hypothetical protein [Branchiibius hedensis]PWJ25488.1 hypothetical protein ATK17_1615 [Branchiibius hedensis]SSA34301.1 hypothetical protein SAMN04489750_1615 [Branchiibius hedensis]